METQNSCATLLQSSETERPIFPSCLKAEPARCGSRSHPPCVSTQNCVIGCGVSVGSRSSAVSGRGAPKVILQATQNDQQAMSRTRSRQSSLYNGWMQPAKSQPILPADRNSYKKQQRGASDQRPQVTERAAKSSRHHNRQKACGQCRCNHDAPLVMKVKWNR